MTGSRSPRLSRWAGRTEFPRDDVVLADGDVLLADGDVLLADGDVLFADGDVLLADGDALFAPPLVERVIGAPRADPDRRTVSYGMIRIPWERGTQ